MRAHQDVAFRTAMLITRNAADAEDAAQEAFVKAHRALHRFRRRRAVAAVAAGDRRQRGAQPAALGRPARGAGRARGGGASAAPPPADAPGQPEAALLSAERRAELLAALERLRDDGPPRLGCRYLLDLSERETSRRSAAGRGP